jgi:hypothetical protein
MLYCDDAIVHHAHALGLRSFCRQHFNYGAAHFHLHRARARRGEQPLRVEPPQFYQRLVGYPFGRVRVARAVTLSALMASRRAST